MPRSASRLRFIAVIGLIASALVPLGAGAYDWPSLNGFSPYTGYNDQETVISAANVGGLHRLFSVTLPAVADGAPIALSGVKTAAGTQDLLFVTTREGHIVALDAHSGAQVWARQYGPGDCHINNGPTVCYTTSSPALDPNHLFVYSYGLDGFVHKYAVGDGAELRENGWPALVTRKGYDEKGSSALAVATAASGASYLYVAHAGYPGDHGNYQGHLTTINLADGTQHVFNAACSDQGDVHFFPPGQGQNCNAVETAIWARQGIVYDPDTDRIYLATGNGDYDGTHYWGDSVFALNPDGTGASGGPLDSYTPENFQQLDSRDADLGSTNPTILPAIANSKVPHLALQGGKDAKLRLLDLDNLSGKGGPGHVGGEVGPVLDVPQGGQVLTAPSVWINPADRTTWVIVTNNWGASGLQLMIGADGVPFLQPVWQNTLAGTSPVVANGVVFYAGGGAIRALDPATGAERWHDAIGSIHWESPTVVNGALYISDGNANLTAYGL